jgi:hypothetical protein
MKKNSQNRQNLNFCKLGLIEKIHGVDNGKPTAMHSQHREHLAQAWVEFNNYT